MEVSHHRERDDVVSLIYEIDVNCIEVDETRFMYRDVDVGTRVRSSSVHVKSM